MSWFDEQALSLGKAVIGGVGFFLWCAAWMKAGDEGYNRLSILIFISPLVIFFMAITGAFK